MKKRIPIPPDMVRAARERFAAGGITKRDLAAEFGISLSAMSDLLFGRTHKLAGGPVLLPAKQGNPDKALLARIAELEAEKEDLIFRLEELTAPPPPFADRDVGKGQRAIIGTLLRRPGQIVSHDALLAAMGSDSLNSLQAQMVSVRRAFPEVEISYSWGVGYRAEWRAGPSRCAAE